MSRRFALPLTVTALLIATSDIAFAAGVVGSGTPESCTEAALDSALTGGGGVTFDCGAAPHTIVITYVKTLTANTNIHGGGTITLSGANSTPFFDIEDFADVLIDGTTLLRGFGEYGAIRNSGTLTIDDSRIEKCTSTGDEGGAISNYGGLAITGTTFAENSSQHGGGAIFSSGGTVNISASTFTENSTTGTSGFEFGGAIFARLSASVTVIDSTFSGNTATYGGAIAALYSLTLDNVTFDGNHCVFNGADPAVGDGGAVFVGAVAEITDSTFTGNEALDGQGGAIFVDYGVLVSISRTTFTENEAGIAGGAIANDGGVSVDESTFHANRGVGAAIFNGSYDTSGENYVALHNTTISDNTSIAGGAVATVSGNIVLTYVTVAGNSGFGGIFEGDAGSFEFYNSVFAYNTPFNCLGLKPIGQSGGFNISSDASCELIDPTDAPSTDPLLGPLADNGGPTLTRLPGPLSPAIDEARCIHDFATDQRGVVRPQGSACDCGAVERAPEDSTSGACGDPVAFVVSNDASAKTVTASDALAVLSAAVGLSACELCVCDVDDSGSIAATDALATLRAAVGLPVDLNCPVCD